MDREAFELIEEEKERLRKAIEPLVKSFIEKTAATPDIKIFHEYKFHESKCGLIEDKTITQITIKAIL